jgi:PPOX class probable F420-dependent enzyme
MEDFLSRPLIAVMTTIRPDGSPHVSPVWFEYDSGKYYVWTGADSAKARNLRLDPHAVLCIASQEEPYRYVVVEGTCEINTTEVPSRCYSISRRYYGESRGAQFARSDLAGGGAVVVVLSPTRVITEASA